MWRNESIGPRRAHAGIVTAVARYDGGVTHDNTPNTPGVAALAQHRVAITRCDDDDSTTSDACAAGRCVFTPFATSARSFCGR